MADLNLISHGMIAFCSQYALEINKVFLKENFDKPALIKSTVYDKLPCCICKHYFAYYDEDKIMNGGINEEDLNRLIRMEYQTCYRETIQSTVEEQNIAKVNEFINDLVDQQSIKIEEE